MTLSITPIPSHAVGDTLPISDWNNVASWLNAGVGYVSSNGLVTANSTTNSGTTGPGTGPFYMFSGSWELTTGTAGTAGVVQVTIPGGGFPNGLIYASAAAFTFNSASTSQAGHLVQVARSSTANVLTLTCYNQSGTALSNTPVAFSLLAIGY